jgi:hypothetical protein
MPAFFEGDPKSVKGGIGWIGLGALAAMVALLAAQLVPSIIPARASQSNL